MSGHLLRIGIPDKDALYMSYIPSFKHGGIFVPDATPAVPGAKKPSMNSQVFMIIKLLNDPSVKNCSGTIAMVCPQMVGNGFRPGIGVAFTDNPQNREVKAMIEKLLVGTKTDLRTYSV